MAFALALGVGTFLVALPLGSLLLKYFKSHGIGEQIRIDGPVSHQLKTGTPTMGGIAIVLPVTIMTAVFNLIHRESMLLPLGTTLTCALIGAVDDWVGLKRGRRAASGERTTAKGGLRMRHKLALQIAMAVGAASILHFVFRLGSFALPSMPTKFSLGLWYFPCAVFVIVATANAVNFTDGLDGLAGNTSTVAFAAFGVIALLQGQLYLVAF
ncbi:MAG: phospho-N-acetylmuramoyl-pentapeptide-transferase, partial [Anaerolineae bacterium]|nr:phospho-N-acetylmuramoyl-pentapeptide-transferase [Anaerolineae bacterium]